MNKYIDILYDNSMAIKNMEVKDIIPFEGFNNWLIITGIDDEMTYVNLEHVVQYSIYKKD